MGTASGDDVGAAVIDCGSWAVRGGMANEDSPRALIPAAVGLRDGSKVKPEEALAQQGDGKAEGGKDGKKKAARQFAVRKKSELVLGDALIGLPHLVKEVVELYSRQADGRWSVEHWDLMQAVWEYVLEDHLALKLENTPVLLVESVQTWGHEGRAAVAERMFESMDVKACFIARSAVMSAFAAGRSTTLVVDAGYQGSSAVPVVEGYALDKSRQWSAVGGRALNEYMLDALNEKVGGAGIRARYETSKGSRQKEEDEAVMDTDGARESSKRIFYRLRLIEDIKESVCSIYQIPKANEEDEGAAAAIPTPIEVRPTTYELPDGNVIDVGQELAERIPESLFDTSLLGETKIPGVSSARALHRLAFDAASACDIDVRRELYSGVILTGGCSLFPKVTERFQRELATITPQMFKLRMAMPYLRQERSSISWIGGSILGSLGTFQQMW
eukprot:CAMPEP_0198736692 /NCGR_PEP_ID=MMETSP1475-20131203/67486_1 /TAXON_ID= ORGANISM="Unidentified sp., Strain CCMP1999" /NCGR_SAMPLE_ID=MMETSP1475 /ASSEMBLY_ACC=CAM_ASM_001111 /LENGTH=444 /DNA_ID=CAMNT_0044500541 /DNA_START=159 /DNA_END=1490 /DNA_ORIENTATION=-